MIREKSGRFYCQFKKSGKMRYYTCAGCSTKKQAERFEKEIRQVMDNFSAQPNAEALTIARMKIKAASECKGEKIDSSIIVLEVLPLEIVSELFQERRGQVKELDETDSKKKKITLQEAFDFYVKVPARRKASAKQTAVNRSYWRDFCEFMNATYPNIKKLEDVDTIHTTEYIDILKSTGVFCKEIAYKQKGRNIEYAQKDVKLSSRTINARHSALKAVFARLTDVAGLKKNPFVFEMEESQAAERQVFTTNELKAIFDNMTMPYTKPIFTVGLFTGLTLGDICLLKWEEIDGEWITNKLRRKTGTRLEIPILAPLQALLDEQRSVSGGGEYVFPELAEMYLNNSTGVNYRVRQFLEGIGIKTASEIEGRTRATSTKAAHALRHTFAYIAGMHNIPLAVVQQVLGHMTPEMTRHYQSHARREEKEMYFKRLAGGFGVQVATSSQIDASKRLALPSSGDTPRERARRLMDTLPDSAIEEILSKYEEAAK